MNVSSTLNKNNIKQLFFIFFNLGTFSNESYFEFNINYRQSKHTEMQLNDEIFDENNKLIKNYTALKFERIGNSHLCRLKNDLKLSREQYLNLIYKNIQQARFNFGDKEFEEALYMGLFCFRGSIDLSRKLYAVDLLAENISDNYIEQLTSLFLSSKGVNQLNLNFRELQPEFVDNKRRRNTQVRINLRWYYDNYINSVKNINIYKYRILVDNKNIILTYNIRNKVNDRFIERLLFYRNRIIKSSTRFDSLGKNEKLKEIKKMREALNFDVKDESESLEISRDSNIVILARAYLVDECVSCKDIYDIKDRTFKRRNSDQLYLEIHHVLSFGSNSESDVFENLVKLCPTCHKALTPYRADEKLQKKIIKNIIDNSPIVSSYLENFLSENAKIEDKINFVYDNLK